MINREHINYYFKNFIIKALIDNNKTVLEYFKRQIEFDKNHPWWNFFENELKLHPEIEYCDLPF